MAVEENKSKVQVSIRWKVILGFTILFTIVYGVALYLFTSFAISATDNQIKADLTQALWGAADGINVNDLIDLAENGEINADGFSDDPRFVEMMTWLDAIHAAEPDAWPYLYVPGDEPNQIKFVVDLWALYDPSNAGGFMEPYTSNSGFIVEGLSNQTYRAVNHQIVQNIINYGKENYKEDNPDLYEKFVSFGTWLTESGMFPKNDFGTYGDKFGRWASGYAPLKDSFGEKVAAIGVDFIADTVNEVRESVSSQINRAFQIAYPFMLILVLLVTNVFSKPLITLAAAAEKIGEGNYEVDFSQLISDKYRDEIDSLASIFEIMVSKVYKREQTLKRQVAQLKIEIDQGKHESEVSEIVETDFFKDLQSRASDLKSKRNKE